MSLEEDNSAITLNNTFIQVESFHFVIDVFKLDFIDTFFSLAGSALRLSIVKPDGDLVSDCVLSNCKGLRLVISGRVEVNTVRTGVTLNVLSVHSALRGIWVL